MIAIQRCGTSKLQSYTNRLMSFVIVCSRLQTPLPILGNITSVEKMIFSC